VVPSGPPGSPEPGGASIGAAPWWVSVSRRAAPRWAAGQSAVGAAALVGARQSAGRACGGGSAAARPGRGPDSRRAVPRPGHAAGVEVGRPAPRQLLDRPVDPLDVVATQRPRSTPGHPVRRYPAVPGQRADRDRFGELQLADDAVPAAPLARPARAATDGEAL